MNSYKVVLYNQDPDLTLRPRRRSITEALEHVEHGDEGFRDGVHVDWKSLRIDQHHFLIDVEERKRLACYDRMAISQSLWNEKVL